MKHQPANGRLTAFLVTLAIAACTGLAAGCGDADTSTQPAQAPEAATDVAREEAAPSPVESFRPSFWIVSEAEDDDGSTVKQRLQFADLVAASDFEPPEGFRPRLAAVCDVNPQRDALIPARLVVVNTTKRFPVDFNSGVVVTWPLDRGPRADVAQQFSDGPSCEPSEGRDIIARVEFNIDAGGTSKHEFLIVLRNYVSPRYPKGDRKGLAAMRATLHTLYTGWTQTCLSASAPLDGEYVRLDGQAITERAYAPDDLPPC